MSLLSFGLTVTVNDDVKLMTIKVCKSKYMISKGWGWAKRTRMKCNCMVSLVVCLNNQRKVKFARRPHKFTTSRAMLIKSLVVEEVHMVKGPWQPKRGEVELGVLKTNAPRTYKNLIPISF